MISLQHILYIVNDWKDLRSQEHSGIIRDYQTQGYIIS